MQITSNTVEQFFESFQSALINAGVSFRTETENQKKLLSIGFDNIKLYNPPTADFIKFKYSGSIIYRFFADEKTIKEESAFIKHYFGDSIPENFSNLVFIRAFVGLYVNIAKKDEFIKYIDEWTSKNNGFKVILDRSCFLDLYKYVNLEEFSSESSCMDSVCQEFLIKELLPVKEFFDYAVKNNMIIDSDDFINLFTDYGFPEFFYEIGNNHVLITPLPSENCLHLRLIYKNEGKSWFLNVYVSFDSIKLEIGTRETAVDTVSFNLTKNVSDKIRQFLSDYASKHEGAL